MEILHLQVSNHRGKSGSAGVAEAVKGPRIPGSQADPGKVILSLESLTSSFSSLFTD